MDLMDIVATSSFWDQPIPVSVPRQVVLPNALVDSICFAIQGVRRCGKSTLLQQLVGHYGLNPAHCAFLNFEDPRLARHLSFEVLDALVDGFRAIRPGVDPLYLFLDEIQEVNGWERWLSMRLGRREGLHFVVTGSNATLLSGELSTSLTGRHLKVELFPFDLDEVRLARPGASVTDFLTDGGFPAPLGMEAGQADDLRRQIFIDIVERDIRERVGARSSLPLRQVLQMAYESAGSEMSTRRVAAATGISVDTAGTYLAAAESAYLLFACPYFAYSERKRSARNRKYYPVDTGLRRVVTTTAGADRGKSLECAVFVALRKRFLDVYYWRDGAEVDFVVQHDGRVVPIQVTWDGPLERHQHAMDRFYEQFPHAAETVFVTADTFEELNFALDAVIDG